MMKENCRECKAVCVMIALIAIIMVFLCINNRADAGDIIINVSGKMYEMEEDSGYVYSDNSEVTSILASGSQFGKFTINGDIESMASVDGFSSFKVKSGVVQFSYVPDGKVISAPNTDRHLYKDSTKTVNGISLEGKMNKGALILQSSNDGVHWLTDVIKLDIANSETDYKSDFFKSQEIQQMNGCYFRVIVAYKTEKNVGQTSVIFGLGEKDVYEYREFAEVYEFYLADNSEETVKKGAHSNIKKVIGDMSNVVNTGKDNGFSGQEPITEDDPHYGWPLGEFSLRGFTDTAYYEGDEYFLKTVGDQITLSFTLLQDISCLNGNPDLSISSDKNGSDQYFQINRTNFGRGTLIVRHTDYENKKSDPIIYTDYLAAYARTGADTRIQFFEEGDYEVALDYEILDSDGFDSYTNYRMFFKFKIRNGSKMVYAFDNKTKSQLTDGSVTADGFTIDLANSHYLIVDINRYTLKDAPGGKVKELSWSRRATNGDSYKETGIYEVTVSNDFQPSDIITKIFYVGTDPFLKAMSTTKKTVEEINEKLNEGYTITEDGTLNPPQVLTPTPMSDQREDLQEEQLVVETSNSPTDQEDGSVGETISNRGVENDLQNMPESSENIRNIWPLVGLVIVIVVLIGVYVLMKKYKDSRLDSRREMLEKEQKTKQKERDKEEKESEDIGKKIKTQKSDEEHRNDEI